MRGQIDQFNASLEHEKQQLRQSITLVSELNQLIDKEQKKRMLVETEIDYLRKNQKEMVCSNTQLSEKLQETQLINQRLEEKNRVQKLVYELMSQKHANLEKSVETQEHQVRLEKVYNDLLSSK